MPRARSTRGSRSPLPPGVIDIDAPQLTFKSPTTTSDDSSSSDASDAAAAAFAAAAAAAGLSRAEREVAWRWRGQGFRGAISTVKKHRDKLALLTVIIDEFELTPNEEWVTWRHKGGLLNRMLHDALDDAGTVTRSGQSSGADSAPSRRRATGPKEGTDRRERRGA